MVQDLSSGEGGGGVLLLGGIAGLGRSTGGRSGTTMRGGAAATALNVAIPSGEGLPGLGGGPGRGLTGLRGLSGLGVPGVPGVPGVLGVLWGLGDSEEQVVAAEEVVLVEEVEVEAGPFFTCSRVSRTTSGAGRQP